MRDIKPKKVVYFSRKPRPLGNFSIETYFKLIRAGLPAQYEGVNVEMPFYNNGLFARLGNAIFCFFKQGDINHITGDIHYVSFFLKKKKTVLTILDCGMLNDSVGVKHFIFKLLWFIIPVKRVNSIIAISNATKDDIIKYTECPAEKIKVIYIAIDTLFKRHEKVFNVDCPRLLQIGTAPNKNLNRLIQALRGINCELVIVGKIGPNLLRLLEENQIKYKLLDTRLSDEEILMEYYKSDILSFVSTLEGFGMPIIEANSVGRPVITGNTTSMPEIAGNAACIVNPFDVDSINAGFRKIISDDNYRKNLVDNGFENIRRFMISQLVVEHVDLYDSMLSSL